MNLEQFYNLCRTKKGATESFPFGGDILVFKVGNKMFALTSLISWENGNPSINLKCNPERSQELREAYEDIIEGYHMSKIHWNTIYVNKSVNNDIVMSLLNHSYDLVFSSLPKKIQNEISEL